MINAPLPVSEVDDAFDHLDIHGVDDDVGVIPVAHQHPATEGGGHGQDRLLEGSQYGFDEGAAGGVVDDRGKALDPANPLHSRHTGRGIKEREGSREGDRRGGEGRKRLNPQGRDLLQGTPQEAK